MAVKEQLVSGKVAAQGSGLIKKVNVSTGSRYIAGRFM